MGAGSGIPDLGALGKAKAPGREEIEAVKVNALLNLCAIGRGQVLMTMALVQMLDAYRLDRKGGKANEAARVSESGHGFAEWALRAAGFKTNEEEAPDGSKERGVADKPSAVRGEGDGLGQHNGGDSGGGEHAIRDRSDDDVAGPPEDGPQH